MNWVGGIKKRILQKEEVKRKQEAFFALHSSRIPEKKLPYEGNQPGHIQQSTTGVSLKTSFDVRNAQIVKSQAKFADDDKFSKLKRLDTSIKNNVSHKNLAKIKTPMYCSPLTKLVLQMNMDAIRQETTSKDVHKINKVKLIKDISLKPTKIEHKLNNDEHKIVTKHTLAAFKDPIESCKVNENNKGFLNLYKRNCKRGLLKGAPRVRKLLTLSPEKHKGKVWTTLDIPTNKKSSIIFKNRAHKPQPYSSKNSLSTNHQTHKTNYSNEKCMEIQRLKLLLGTPATEKYKGEIAVTNKIINNCVDREKSCLKDVEKSSVISKTINMPSSNISNISFLPKRNVYISNEFSNKNMNHHKRPPSFNHCIPNLSDKTRNVVTVHCPTSGRLDKTHYMDTDMPSYSNANFTISTASSKTPSDPSF